MQSMYEYAVWRDTQDEVIRPGGLELSSDLLDLCELHSQSRVLDLGCGCAATLRLAKERFGCEIYGLDISRKLLMRALQRPCESCFIQATVDAIPFAASSFDLVILECTASIFGTDKIIPTAAQLLKPGGKLMLTDLYARKADGLADIRRMPQGTCIQGVVLMEDIFSAFEKSGLQLVYWQDYSSTMKKFPMQTLSSSIKISVFDLIVAAASINLGYYGLVIEKK